MDDFRAFMITVSERLSADDVDKLAYAAQLPNDPIVRERRGALDVLQALEKKDLFNIQSLDGLCQMLHTIGRSDVARAVKEYCPPPAIAVAPEMIAANAGRRMSDNNTPNTLLSLESIGRCASDVGRATLTNSPTSAPNTLPSLGSIGRCASDVGPATPTNSSDCLSPLSRGYSFPESSRPSSPPLHISRHQRRFSRWVLTRKALNEDIYEHKCQPFRRCWPIKVHSQLCPPAHLPRLHLTLYPSGLEEDRGTHATLEGRVELPTDYRGRDTSAILLTLRVSAHDCWRGTTIAESEVRSTLNAQKVTVRRFISHEALKTSHSRQIEVKAWAWSSLVGDDDRYKVETVDDNFELISVLQNQ